ncbi:hypothetical protein EVA_14405 [gut metagenome]|uniref:Uncharacterized protein n=1 Tax=gut metagenome TaxID=749906 RepID=J9G6S1_9ZZZZ
MISQSNNFSHIYSKFIGGEISNKSLERLLKKRNFANSVDKSPVLLITKGRFSYPICKGAFSAFYAQRRANIAIYIGMLFLFLAHLQKIKIL